MRQLSCGIVVKRVFYKAVGAVDCPVTEVLLQFRRQYNASSISDFSQWEFPGGKLDGNETAENCACRELNEETGLLWIDGRQLFYVDHRSKFGCVMWECTRYSGEATIKEPDKQSAIGWFDVDRLPENLTPDTKTSIAAGALTR